QLPIDTAEAVSQMKKFYMTGMKAFAKQDYETAIDNLKHALQYKEKKVLYYYYAEANATLGVIYHFHSKVEGHKELAYRYYKKALAIDPTTKSAKKYIKMLKPPAKGAGESTPKKTLKAKAPVKKKAKAKKKPTPV